MEVKKKKKGKIENLKKIQKNLHVVTYYPYFCKNWKQNWLTDRKRDLPENFQKTTSIQKDIREKLKKIGKNRNKKKMNSFRQNQKICNFFSGFHAQDLLT